jgi:hypothetical protein
MEDLKLYKIIEEEKGATVLFLIIIILVSLMIFGVMILKTETTETKIVGNDRIKATDFYQTESADIFIKKSLDNILYNNKDFLNKSLINVGDVSDIQPKIWADAGLPGSLSGTIKLVSVKPPDVNTGYSAIHMQMNTYVIKVVSPNRTNIEIGVSKPFKRNDPYGG